MFHCVPREARKAGLQSKMEEHVTREKEIMRD